MKKVAVATVEGGNTEAATPDPGQVEETIANLDPDRELRADFKTIFQWAQNLPHETVNQGEARCTQIFTAAHGAYDHFPYNCIQIKADTTYTEGTVEIPVGAGPEKRKRVVDIPSTDLTIEIINCDPRNDRKTRKVFTKVAADGLVTIKDSGLDRKQQIAAIHKLAEDIRHGPLSSTMPLP